MSNWIASSNRWDYRTPPKWWDMPFPILQAAVNETTQATQAPIKMVHHCGHNAIFSALQGLIDYQRPDGGDSPVTNISLIIGETGERKSSVDRYFFHEIFKFREAQSSASPRADVEYSVKRKIWAIEQKILEKQLRPSIGNNKLGTDRLIEALVDHGLSEPQQAKRITFIYQDTSLASLKRGLANFPFACVHSAEGMSIFSGPLFKEMSLLCELYSGETHFFDRTGKTIALQDRRLCVSAHSQPLRTIRFLAKMGNDFRDSGLAARMTVCLLQSTQGSRTYDSIQIPSPYRDCFNDRIGDLLKISVRAGRKVGFQRRKIRFSPSATREYLAHANWIERQMRPNGKFEYARDYANRLPDKIGRLSAALHRFEDFEGDISLDTYWAVRSIYEEETEDFFYLFNYIPSEQHLADQLLQWLQKQTLVPNEPGIRKSYIEHRCLAGLRRIVALDPVLGLLQQQGKIQLKMKSNIIYVCPPLVGSYAPTHHLTTYTL